MNDLAHKPRLVGRAAVVGRRLVASRRGGAVDGVVGRLVAVFHQRDHAAQAVLQVERTGVARVAGRGEAVHIVGEVAVEVVVPGLQQQFVEAFGMHVELPELAGRVGCVDRDSHFPAGGKNVATRVRIVGQQNSGKDAGNIDLIRTLEGARSIVERERQLRFFA